ncbi:app1-like, partial [Asbolus verrucosus]
LAWVTLATNDSYSLGALVLAHSLKQVGTTKQLVVLVTPGVTNPMREKLSSVFDVVQEVNILDSKDETNLRLLKRPELGVTFTKLHCWRLTQFDKCVFLDADTLVLQNCDELFDREELSAAPDVGWPDCFNSGVFVYRPSNETYEKLVQFALEKGSFDGGDQGLLNLYFSDWSTKDISKHLPFIYNLCSTACYSYLPAFKQFGADAKVIHFIGASKPWLQYFNTETRKVQPSGDLRHLEGVLQHWWNIFCNLIHPKLSPEMARSSSDVTHTSMSSHIPENHYKPPPVSTKNEIWDPWEEYDQRQSSVPPRQIHEPSQEKPFESHNTNARNIASDQNIPFPVIEQPNRPESPPHHQNVPPMASAAVSERPHSFQSFNVNPTIEQPHSFPSFAVNPTVEQHHPLPSSVVKPTAKQHHSFPSFAAVDPAVITPPKVNDHHIPQESLTAVDFSQSSTVQPVFIEFVPKPNEPIHPSVPPSECEAAVTVCKETTLHTPPREDEADSGLAGAFAQLTLGAPRTAEQSALDDHLRRQGWEPEHPHLRQKQKHLLYRHRHRKNPLHRCRRLLKNLLHRRKCLLKKLLHQHRYLLKNLHHPHRYLLKNRLHRRQRLQSLLSRRKYLLKNSLRLRKNLLHLQRYRLKNLLHRRRFPKNPLHRRQLLKNPLHQRRLPQNPLHQRRLLQNLLHLCQHQLKKPLHHHKRPKFLHLQQPLKQQRPPYKKLLRLLPKFPHSLKHLQNLHRKKLQHLLKKPLHLHLKKHRRLQ